MQPLRNALLAVILAALALSSVGCHRYPVLKPAEPKAKVPVTEGFDEALPKSFIERYQPDVRMGARWERGGVAGGPGGRVWVSITNRTDKTIAVSAANFGVIVRDKKLYPVVPGEVVAQFPSINLAPGTMASGNLLFKRLGDLTDQRCVFSHPAVRPSMCFIRPMAEKRPAPKAAPAPKLGVK